MRIALVVAILLLLCGVGVCDESQPSSFRTEKQKPEINKTYSATRQDKKSETAIVARQPTTNSPQDGTNTQPPEDKNLIVNQKIAKYTGYLALLAFLQFVAMAIQAVFLCKTLGATKEAANAANKAAEAAEMTAKAAIGVELPRFIVTSMRLDWSETGPYIIVYLSNQGRTEAIITEECLIYSKKPALAPHPRYPIHFQRRIDFGKVVKSGNPCIIKENIPIKDISENSDSPIIWGYGYIKYRDFLGKIHTSGFVGGVPMQSCNVVGATVLFEQQGPAAYTYEIYEENEA